MWKNLWTLGGDNHWGLRMRTRGTRGLFATQDIPPGARILEIPEEHLMTIESVYDRNPSIRKVYPHKAQMNDRVIYHLYQLLTGAVKPTPSEKIYLSSLPKDVSNFCLFYDKKNVLRPLKGTCFSRQNPDPNHLFHSIDNYRMHYDHTMDQLGIPQETRDAYLKSTVMVNSRVFQFRDGKKDRMGLVPIADLINHHNQDEVNTTWYFDDDKRVFVVQATRLIPSGAQVYDSYGQKNDLQLLYTYGFYMPENEYGNIIIPQSHGQQDLVIPRNISLGPNQNINTQDQQRIRGYTARLHKILKSISPEHPLRQLLHDQYEFLKK